MANTPDLTPPIVQKFDARLFVHEKAFGAILNGFRKAHPELFIVGSFNVAKPQAPIRIPKPGGQDAVINFRVEIANLDFDISPNDLTDDGFADPFTLSGGQIGFYAAVIADLAGAPTDTWSERLNLRAWIKVQSTNAGGVLAFSIIDVSVQLDGVTSPALISILNHILTIYLEQTVGQFSVNLNGLLNGGKVHGQIQGLSLSVNAADASATV